MGGRGGSSLSPVGIVGRGMALDHAVDAVSILLGSGSTWSPGVDWMAVFKESQSMAQCPSGDG